MDLKSLTIDAARSAVQERETTAMALAEAHYARIQKEDGQIGAFLTLSKERALEQADRMDRMAADGKTLPPLGGVPVGIKDVMSTRGVRTHRGVEDSGELHSSVRLHGRGATGGRGRGGVGQDELRRVCHGLVE